MELDTNNHSVFKLNYHLIMVVNYRKKVIDDTISARLKSIFENIDTNHHVSIKEWNHDTYQIHVLITAIPNTELSKFINAFKSASSRRNKNEFPEIRQRLWKEYFWSQSYCLLTVDGAPLEVLKQYIETQGKK
ncbi:IS200/IS605 family transposase [Pseudogracilibacillus auburnensis]|uniref:IS200/IS605 family transposase n=1 Tax=Pseudogracilibacillus auburnensis TaxID=1494959 RepID=UPI001A964FA9|nr:IS200/IS605 family transposase [Pseudogracilibacillus auburnensis]MBO1005107.1 IS200/IS605 family transposase [Pseudogracilibacillus auburnensis]